MKNIIVKAKILTAAMFAAVIAVSPVFSLTSAASTETIQDNILEYEEIPELMHLNNVTIKNNEYALKQYKRDYGESNEELREAYSELADNLLNAADYSAEDPEMDPTYGMRVAMAINNENAAKQYQNKTDSTLDDYETNRLTYEMNEKQLIQSAKTNMITYYSSLLNADSADSAVKQARKDLEIARTRNGIGMATSSDIYSAQEKLLSSEQKVTDSRAAAENAKRKLQIACGWTYGDDVQLGTLPEPDSGRVDSINVDEDIQKAINNNYTYRINQRRLENAVYSDSKDNMSVTLESNRQKIAASVRLAYDNIVAAADACKYAEANMRLQNAILANANAKLSTGSASKYELQSQQTLVADAEILYKQNRLQLLLALMNYDCIIDGLASA